MKKIISIICVIAVIFSSLTVFSFAGNEDFKPYDDSRFFEYGDYEIHYRVVPAEGEMKGRIMMLHGFLCSTYAWRNMAEILSEEGYECVMAEILITELMKSIAPMDEWIIAGHSMGGGVAVNIAINNPVKNLLLYCPAPQSEFPDAMEGLMTSGFTGLHIHPFSLYQIH